MRKTIILVLALILILSFTLISSASSDVKVIVNGEKVTFPDATPYINEDSRTLVPVRFIAENLGCSVDWKDEIRQVGIEGRGKGIKLNIGENKASVDGEEIEFDTKAIINYDRTFVPLRFVSEALGAKVEWNGESRTVFISTENTEDREQEEETNKDFIEPKFEVDYNEDGMLSHWFNLKVSNYEEYKKSEDKYKMKFECLNYPELNYYYTIITTDWVRCDKAMWRDNPYGFNWRLLQHHLLEASTEKEFQTKAGMKIQLKITVWNTTKDIKKEYEKEIEVKEVNFKW